MATRGIDLFEAALAAEGVTGRLADLSRSIYMQESGGGRNSKTSNAGARGGMQIIPSTFASVADRNWNIDDPMDNARAGIRYIKQLDKRSGGDSALTAAGYYGGPGGMDKARKGIAVSDPRNPNAPTTLEYGQQVVKRMNKGQGQDNPVTTVAASQPVTNTRGDNTRYAMAPNQGNVNPENTPIPEEMRYSDEAPVEPMQVAQVAPQDLGPNPWLEFQRAVMEQGPITAQSLSYGNQASAMPQLAVPDFMAALRGAGPTPINFQSFRGWGSLV